MWQCMNETVVKFTEDISKQHSTQFTNHLGEKKVQELLGWRELVPRHLQISHTSQNAWISVQQVRNHIREEKFNFHNVTLSPIGIDA